MSRYAKVPEALLDDLEVSATAVRVWAKVERYAGRGGKCYASVTTLAADLGVSRATIQRALTDLSDGGWISRRERPGNVWETVAHQECTRSNDEAGRGSTDEAGGPHECDGGVAKMRRGCSKNEASKEGALPVSSTREQYKPATAPRRNAKANLAVVENDTLVDVEPEPSASRPVTAQTLVGRWIDHCENRPPREVVGPVSKALASLLRQGIDPAIVETGLAAWHSKGLHPSALPSVVNEVLNPPARRNGASPPRSTTDERVAQGLALVQKYEAMEREQLAIEGAP